MEAANTELRYYNLLNSILLLPCLIVYYIVSVLFLLSFAMQGHQKDSKNKTETM